MTATAPLRHAALPTLAALAGWALARGALAQDAGVPSVPPRDASSAVDATAISAPPPRRAQRAPMRGSYRGTARDAALLGVIFLRDPDAPTDLTRGRIEPLWRRGRGRAPTDLASGAYRVEGASLVTSDRAGRPVNVAFEWIGQSIRLQLGADRLTFERANWVCSEPRDCGLQATLAPRLSCPTPVRWSCERHGDDSECLAHCGAPTRATARHRCGDRWCPSGRVCCNPIQGVCTRPGEGCGQ